MSSAAEPQFIVGIDLGTSNCALAFAEPAQGTQAPVVDFPVLQVNRPGEVLPLALLPSCIYLPGEHELARELIHLPWSEEADRVVGEFARWQGARVPGRFVSSAKSWLCHPGVDRSAPILPWGGPPEVPKVSPVEASAALLAHMRAAWDFAHPTAPLSEQEVVITVPASFDEAARSLTVGAARRAGLEKFTLLEEPQAAFYDFTAHHRDDLATALHDIRLVLVVDVGGGTSDFTLVQVAASEEGPAMRRLAVGEHLMLGGDNMDAALARKAEEQMLAKSPSRKLTVTQWTQLVQAARLAKEALLTESGPAEYNISILAEGSRLLGGSLSARISRPDAETVVLDGFVPFTAPTEEPQRGTRTALQELGLPYASDPAITRHLSAFLCLHAAAGFEALGTPLAPRPTLPAPRSPPPLPRPDAILLNGGVFNSAKIAARLVEAVSAWWPDEPQIPLLRHESLDLAVARGAAYYGLVRHGLGRRISGGAAHALYVGLQQEGNTNPMAVCLIPRGQEEGESIELRGQTFQLALGRPVRFPLYSTAADRLDPPGAVVAVSEDMHPLPPIHTLLAARDEGRGARDEGRGPRSTPPVPRPSSPAPRFATVHLRAALTEIGTLELWCVASEGNQVWRLEFELRGDQQATTPTITESMPASFAEARLWIDYIYGGKPRTLSHLKAASPKDPKALWTSLEETLGARESWRLPVLRELWSVLFAGATKRRRSAIHERVFYQLLGYSLRPGFGYALDDWRCEQSASLFDPKVEFHKEIRVWAEFWIFWRRIAGGLSKERHDQIWDYLKPFLAVRIPPGAAKGFVKPKGPQPEALDEMVRLAAALEHLEPGEKVALGHWIVQRLRHEALSGPWTWALGRLGARSPIYGSSHRAVPPGVAAEWGLLLLDSPLVQLEGSLFALAQLGRLTGDRARDLDEPLRARILAALKSGNAPESWQHMLTEVIRLEAADEARALGDTLPVGLILSHA